MQTIRASSLDRIWACPPSQHAPDLAIGSNMLDRADLGTAFHECFADAIHGTEPDLDALAAKYTVDREELGMLVGKARRVWAEICVYFPEPETEVSMAHGILTGTTDLIASAGRNMLAVLDHKSGWEIGEHENQLKCYGWLALQLDKLAESVWCGIYYVRHGKLMHRVYTRADLEGWYDQLQERLGDATYRPGPHCGYCPRRYSCEARTSQLRQLCEVLLGKNYGELPADPHSLAELLQKLRVQAKDVARMADEALTFTKTTLEAHGGELPMADGSKLAIVRAERDEIDARIALPVLQQRFAEKPEALAEALSLSKTKLEKAVGAIAPARGKGKLMAAVMKDLAEAGAVSKVPFQEKVEVVHE